MTLTLSLDQERVTRKAQTLSRAAGGRAVYVVRDAGVYRAVQAADIAGERNPDIIATYRGGEEVETPEGFAYAA